MSDINKLLDDMWKDYVKLNPQAQRIVNMIEARGVITSYSIHYTKLYDQ